MRRILFSSSWNILYFSAIDNATRGLTGMGQLPVTCGLFFLLGHSTIVIAVVSILYSTADKLPAALICYKSYFLPIR